MWANKQQECNLGEVMKIVKDRCNGAEIQNIIAKMSEESLLTLHQK